MPQRMVYYVGGPADGLVQLMQEDQHPFVVYLNTDTNGCYVMDYQIVGRPIGGGDLELTSGDVTASWHQRSSAQDFMTGDKVIVKDTGARGVAFAPTTYVNDDGTTDEGWMVSIDSKLMFLAPHQIRIATSQELSDEEPATPDLVPGSLAAAAR